MTSNKLTEYDAQIVNFILTQDFNFFSDKEYNRLFEIFKRVEKEIQTKSYDVEVLTLILSNWIIMDVEYHLGYANRTDKGDLIRDLLNTIFTLDETQTIMANYLVKTDFAEHDILCFYRDKNISVRALVLKKAFDINEYHFEKHFFNFIFTKEDALYFKSLFTDINMFNSFFQRKISIAIKTGNYHALGVITEDVFKVFVEDLSLNAISINFYELSDFLKFSFECKKTISESIFKLIDTTILKKELQNNGYIFYIKNTAPSLNCYSIKKEYKALLKKLLNENVEFNIISKKDSLNFLDFTKESQDFIFEITNFNKKTCEDITHFLIEYPEYHIIKENGYIEINDIGKNTLELNYRY